MFMNMSQQASSQVRKWLVSPVVETHKKSNVVIHVISCEIRFGVLVPAFYG